MSKSARSSRRSSPAGGQGSGGLPSDERGSGSGSSDRDPQQRRALQEMLARAVKGDQHAWRVLVDTYAHRVFGLIRAQCGSADLAEEITQSAFCTVVAKIGSYSELGKFEQWLFRIAMNRLRDEMRRRKRQARPTEDETLHALADMGAGVPSSVAARGDAGTGDLADADTFAGASPEQLAALRAALAELPDADQQIIRLRHAVGLSFKEIADILDQPLGTVLARQHRALKKLAETLQPVVERESSIGRVRAKPSSGEESET